MADPIADNFRKVAANAGITADDLVEAIAKDTKTDRDRIVDVVQRFVDGGDVCIAVMYAVITMSVARQDQTRH